MCDHSIYILYSLTSKDLQRTLRKSSVRPVVNLSHAPKLFLRGLNSINSAKTARKCLGTEGLSQISRIPRQNVSNLQTIQFSGLSITSVDNKGVIIVILFHFFYNLTFQILKFSVSLSYCGSIKYK